MIRTQTNMLLGGGLLAASQAVAGDLLLWQTNSLSYLYGKNFAINPSIQQTVTFEHADKWKYGDNFLFVDKIFYGYLDWVVDNDQNSRGTYHANLHFNPQLKYDLGKALGWSQKQLYVGTEYSYWKNKYGVENSSNLNTHQNTASLLVKVHF